MKSREAGKAKSRKSKKKRSKEAEKHRSRTAEKQKSREAGKHRTRDPQKKSKTFRGKKKPPVLTKAKRPCFVILGCAASNIYCSNRQPTTMISGLYYYDGLKQLKSLELVVKFPSNHI